MTQKKAKKKMKRVLCNVHSTYPSYIICIYTQSFKEKQPKGMIISHVQKYIPPYLYLDSTSFLSIQECVLCRVCVCLRTPSSSNILLWCDSIWAANVNIFSCLNELMKLLMKWLKGIKVALIWGNANPYSVEDSVSVS